MPRFVRPGFISGVENPRDRSGWARATVTVRTPAGDISDPVTVSAGGMDSSGAGRVDVEIPAGFAVEIDGIQVAALFAAGGAILPNPRRGVSIVIRPA